MATARVSATPTVNRRARSRPAVHTDPFYLPKPIDNSRLIKVADPQERRSQFKLVWLSLLLLSLVLGAACQRFALICTGYRIEQLKGQQEQLLEAGRLLRLDEAKLRDPGRIDQLARNQLGMAAPAPGQVVYLEKPGRDLDGTAVARNSGVRF